MRRNASNAPATSALRSSALAGTFAAWENEYVRCVGQPPYHPRDLAGLYLYGLLNRLRSSRQLEAACYNRLDVLWLLQRQTPDHATIAAFVRDHRPRLRQLFRDVVQVGLRAELIRLEEAFPQFADPNSPSRRVGGAPISEFKAKDIFRASGLPLLGISNAHVEKDRQRIQSGRALSPFLLHKGFSQQESDHCGRIPPIMRGLLL